jgi:DNA-binding response OmpR family regulator
MGWILLAGKDWQARALLRAQLLEEGLKVEAQETVREALATLESGTPLPALLVADLSASDDPSVDVELLQNWTTRVPIWIIASHKLIIDRSLKGRGFEMILFRPVDVGELVEQIKQRLET